jgi:hypothetical protein
MLASAALCQLSPRKTYGSNFLALRNYPGRELSPMRPRAGSVKRKPDDTISYASAASSGTHRQISPEKIETLSVNISTVSSLCDKVDTALSTAETGQLKDILTDLSAAVRLINSNHETIVKEQLAPASRLQQSSMVNIGTIPKRTRPSIQVLDPVALPTDNVFSDTDSECDRKKTLARSRKNSRMQFKKPKARRSFSI